MRVATKAASVLIFAAVLMSCGEEDETGPNPVPGGGVTVNANASDQFVPATVDVAVGGTVTWAFGPVSHDVVFSQVAGAPANIGITVNNSVSRTFSTAGVFPYTCSLHSGMNGTVRVGQ